ncbi:DUF6906 family protein [Metasolibacillus meyeri]|uniref:DUF6906 family protein n=1 Tax=Metasolibacillus meyeri TaxID=1071052 RepID=UPI00187D23D9|nr:hypothetical protein [Metasolibacillus meyeri]
MKNGKKLTRNESEHIKNCRLNPKNWLLSKKMLNNWIIVHRVSGRTREIPAPAK